MSPAGATTAGASTWGDWHFAQALTSALARQGCDARCLPVGESHRVSAEVHVVIRGLDRPIWCPQATRVLWVISHPELVDGDECDAADLVLVASAPFATHLAARTETPVHVLHQATDRRRFRPRAPDAALRADLAVFANRRTASRPAVRDACAAGLRPTVWGRGWGDHDGIDLRGSHLGPDALVRAYSSAGLVLNDHWPAMRTWGFLSNRLFDVVACGTPVATDAVVGLDDVFDGLVPTWRSPDELRSIHEATLADAREARRRAADARRLVLDHHTFDHRAGVLVDLLR